MSKAHALSIDGEGGNSRANRASLPRVSGGEISGIRQKNLKIVIIFDIQ
jgi:hypothetical protein